MFYVFIFEIIIFKELIDSNNRLLKDKEDEVTELRLQLAEAKNIRFNNQELHDALIHDFKKTISVNKYKKKNHLIY